MGQLTGVRYIYSSLECMYLTWLTVKRPGTIYAQDPEILADAGWQEWSTL